MVTDASSQTNHELQGEMKRTFLLVLATLSLGLSRCSDSVPEETADVPSTFFTLLPPNRTGVDFINEVVDEENFNILTYRNFYNGGGVAIGDINNDSLPDIYLTANQKKNRLYLNKGNLYFEDITDKAGVGGSKAWSTGVTMADVNADGLLDIYVCNSGDVTGSLRENELFINNGDLTFTEQGAAYNLDNDGYSTHAAFFDYDSDGDLDCYILNNSFKDPSRIELYKKMREQPDPGGDKLMRNDGNIFRDVTAEAGIFSSSIGFGLGVAIADLNQDYLPDIYISNDFWERDYLYINIGQGKFSEELIDRMNYCSVSSMGADVADINNDGTQEVFTTDMLPADDYRLKTTMTFDPYHLEDLKYRANYYYQMVQNCLHLNDGNGNFQEIALMSGVSATDWSWGALIFDFENDGLKDVFVSNGILRNIMSMDFREFIADNKKRDVALAGKSKLGHREFISFIPDYPLRNYAFRNQGNLKFINDANRIGLSQESYSNGASYGDLDNDGDHDLVINNVNASCFIYRNDSDSSNAFLKVKFKGSDKNPFGIGAQVTVKTSDGIHVLQNHNARGFESSIEPHLLFGLGEAERVDEVQVIWPDGKVQVVQTPALRQTMIASYDEASPSDQPKRSEPALFKEVGSFAIDGDARHVENTFNDFDQEILLPRMISTEGPRLVNGDVNGDMLQDFILLGAANDPDKIFLQKDDGSFQFKPSAALLSDRGFESTCGALFDHDGDGDMDLMIGAGGNEAQLSNIMFIVRLYRNDGHGNFSVDPRSVPPVTGNFSTLEASDFDGDGDVDVFLGARVVAGNYGVIPRSYLLRNDAGRWTDVASDALGKIGMVTDACWADIDSDSDLDLVVVGDWMPISLFRNENGILGSPEIIPKSKGWWNRIEPSDLDGDGDLDFVAGNWGLNTKFRATEGDPMTMFVSDFDDNGKSEFIIEWYPPDDSMRFPFAQKAELTAQLPSLRKQILKHADYANKPADSLFSRQTLEKATRHSVEFMESAILWNRPGGFEISALPWQAQVSPVFGIAVHDFNNDGSTDIWLGGNFYALKPQAGRHDASKGVLLLGNGKGSWNYVAQSPTGLFTRGEVRDAVVVASGASWQLLVARNNDRVLLFRRGGPSP
jgi:enediyne biosynthesis protein E4